MAAKTYETVLIAEPELSAEQAEQLVTKVKQVISGQSGNVTNEDRWGRRRLAYPIQGHRDGFYVILAHTSESGVVGALDHFFNVTDTVIRHMTTRVIKSKKTFAPRRERPAGAPEGYRSGGRPGSNRGPRPTSGPATTPSATAPAAEAPASTPASESGPAK